MTCDVLLCCNKQPADLQQCLDTLGTIAAREDMRLTIYYDIDFATAAEEQEAIDALTALYPYTMRVVAKRRDGIVPGRGISAGRNALLSYISAYDEVMFLDDDVLLDRATYDAMRTFTLWYQTTYKKLCVIAPVLYYRDTDHIQMIGFSGFSYLLGWPLPMHTLDWRGKVRQHLAPPRLQKNKTYAWYDIACVGGSLLFGSYNAFLPAPYDERIPYIYEDLDMSLRLSHRGIQLLVPSHVTARHMERPKTPLEQAFIGSRRLMKQKASHRVRFARSHSSWWQKIVYMCCGLHIHTVWLFVKVIIYRQFYLLVPLLVGTRDGIFSVIRDPSISPVASFSTSATGDTKT